MRDKELVYLIEGENFHAYENWEYSHDTLPLQQYSEAPPVHRGAILLSQEQLRCNILSRPYIHIHFYLHPPTYIHTYTLTTKRSRSASHVNVLFRQSEIRKS